MEVIYQLKWEKNIYGLWGTVPIKVGVIYSMKLRWYINEMEAVFSWKIWYYIYIFSNENRGNLLMKLRWYFIDNWGNTSNNMKIANYKKEL